VCSTTYGTDCATPAGPNRRPSGIYPRVPLQYLQDFCRYWAEEYDWPAARARLNEHAQFRTDIDGLGLHFLHVRSPHPDALPFILTHGGPGSVLEFRRVIRPLTDPSAHGGHVRDAFYVVAPSLPGYGFSDKPTEPGWGIDRIAEAWSVLMRRLGYRRYGAAGSDWGISITTVLAGHARGLDPGEVHRVVGLPRPPGGGGPSPPWSSQSSSSRSYVRSSGSCAVPGPSGTPRPTRPTVHEKVRARVGLTRGSRTRSRRSRQPDDDEPV